MGFLVQKKTILVQNQRNRGKNLPGIPGLNSWNSNRRPLSNQETQAHTEGDTMVKRCVLYRHCNSSNRRHTCTARSFLSLGQLSHKSNFPRVSWVILSQLKDGTAFRVVLMLCMNNLEKVHGLSIYTQCNCC